MTCHQGLEKPASHLFQNTKEVGINQVHDIRTKIAVLFLDKMLYIYLQRVSYAIVGKFFFIIASCVRFVMQLKKQSSHHFFHAASTA